ncbi:GtrA family protein [Allosphingosinicella flava]|uniref:GtrA family protein n=1 Tax=Allosphingosinicella flava TaxID=2771430 RepID=A0A7T2GIQ7_9SPHN|nr:GtrA family protein [Sphingosinicella flava]QPQ54629.1 GtrA family protein [Sphingosinicella flava]
MDITRKDSEAQALLMQFIRFGMTGGFVTLLGIGVYLLAAMQFDVLPFVANVLAYAVAVTTGYVLHSRFSFRGHGRRDNAVRTTGRFFIVSMVSLALNSLFVWVLTGPLGGPDWWPTIPMLFVTPLVTFSLNRHWVFA